MRHFHPLAHRPVPPLSPVLLAGLALRPLPPALFQPVFGLAIATMRRRHVGAFERLAGGTPFSNGLYYGMEGIAFRGPSPGASPPARVKSSRVPSRPRRV